MNMMYNRFIQRSCDLSVIPLAVSFPPK